MRKLLLVSSTFYPDTAVASVRATQWAKYLPEYGWKPLIVCRNYGTSASAEVLAEELNDHVKVTYLNQQLYDSDSLVTSDKVARKVSKELFSWLLSTISVPDVSVWKWRSFRKAIHGIVEAERPDAILTTSPPHSIHLLGLSVKKNSIFRGLLIFGIRICKIGGIGLLV